MQRWALINGDNIVERVICADKSFIDSGHYAPGRYRAIYTKVVAIHYPNEVGIGDSIETTDAEPGSTWHESTRSFTRPMRESVDAELLERVVSILRSNTGGSGGEGG